MPPFHYDILDPERQDLLKTLSPHLSGSGFYLAGGTGLAMLYGHRDSIDFDWFRQGDLNGRALFSDLRARLCRRGSLAGFLLLNLPN